MREECWEASTWNDCHKAPLYHWSTHFRHSGNAEQRFLNTLWIGSCIPDSSSYQTISAIKEVKLIKNEGMFHRRRLYITVSSNGDIHQHIKNQTVCVTTALTVRHWLPFIKYLRALKIEQKLWHGGKATRQRAIMGWLFLLLLLKARHLCTLSLISLILSSIL